jgi:hypothetical protein
MTFRSWLPAACAATGNHGFGDRGGNIMKPGTTLATVLCLAVGLWAGDALAQQKQKVSYKVSEQNSKYTQQLALDAGDAPGHQVRVYEIHRTFPAEAPLINGVKLKETWTRGISDYTDYNGPSSAYTTYLFENGDKFFVRATTLGQQNAAGKRATVSVGQITGGTGKFAGIQGMTRSAGLSDPKGGQTATDAEVEYWFAK